MNWKTHSLQVKELWWSARRWQMPMWIQADIISFPCRTLTSMQSGRHMWKCWLHLFSCLLWKSVSQTIIYRGRLWSTTTPSLWQVTLIRNWSPTQNSKWWRLEGTGSKSNSRCYKRNQWTWKNKKFIKKRSKWYITWVI